MRRSSLRTGATREHENMLVVQDECLRPCLGALRHPIAARGLDPPAALVPMQDRRAVEPEQARRPSSTAADRGRAGETGERFRLGADPPRLRRAPRSERDDAADDRRDGDEDDDREDVLALADRERVQGRDEVPVDEQGAHDCAGQRRPESADRGDHDDEEQEEQQHARQLELVAHVREDDRQQRAAPTAASNAPSSCRLRGSVSGRRVRGTTKASSDSPPGWLITWTSMPTPDSRITLPMTEPRVSSLPARAAARSHDDLRRVQRTRCVEQRGPDVRADDLVVRPAELLEELALLLEQRCRRRGEPVLRDHVHAHEVALRALRNPRRASDETLAVGGTGERDEDALARLPRLVDPVAAR